MYIPKSAIHKLGQVHFHLIVSDSGLAIQDFSYDDLDAGLADLYYFVASFCQAPLPDEEMPHMRDFFETLVEEEEPGFYSVERGTIEVTFMNCEGCVQQSWN